jgi:hypothetical protein
MSRRNRQQSLRESKARRQKQLAIGGGVVLAILLAWEAPHYLGGGSKSPAAATSTTTTSGSSAAPSTASSSAAAPTTTSPGTAAAAAGAPTKLTKLPNSNTAPRRNKSQLASFSRFVSKDPFVPQVTVPIVSPSTPGSGSSAASTASTPGTPGGSTSSTTQQSSARTLARSGSATIAVNGKSETVQVGATFPSSNPVFTLVSLMNGKAQIGIANGSYKSGAQTVSLSAGKTLTLVDATDGVRYELRLVSGP